MPRSKKPVQKLWAKSRTIPVVKPSKFEQNEASVRKHWKNVIMDLESTYKDEKFWESHADKIRHLGPVILKRLTKIFDLSEEKVEYIPNSETSVVPSDEFYKTKSTADIQLVPSVRFSMSGYESNEDLALDEEDEHWTASTEEELIKSRLSIREFSQKLLPKNKSKSFSKQSRVSSRIRQTDDSDKEATTNDDLEVHVDKKYIGRRSNHHHKMLYCSESETDMISWKSKYKNKSLNVSLNDDFNKKSEMTSKKIAKEFFDWWTDLGTEDFKSEIKRPEDIEDLFQVWFDEHASRGLVVDLKPLPCVLQSVARAVAVPKSACQSVLKRQVKHDIEAETSPAHTVAFGTCLPEHLKHVPPNNKTEELWHKVRIPEDLKSMACVWEDIDHLTSTKAFQEWLRQHPHLPMPPCLDSLPGGQKKKPLFIIPSDILLDGTSSPHELSFPVSKYKMDLKDVIEKVMND